MSLTNLTLFLNRVMHDGQYQTAILLYSYEAIRDTNFIQEITDHHSRHYTIVAVGIHDNSTQLLESVPYRNIRNALQIIMVYRNVPYSDVLFSRHIVYLVPMQNDKMKRNILNKIHRQFQFIKGNFSMIFYQTPRTIQQAKSNNSIEVYVLNSHAIAPDRSVFKIDLESDILFQLNQTANLCDDIFVPWKKTSMCFLGVGVKRLRNVKNSMNSTKTMSGNANVFMVNYITRYMKNLTAWNLVPTKIYNHFEMAKYNSLNNSTYAELFIPSMEYHDSQEYWEM